MAVRRLLPGGRGPRPPPLRLIVGAARSVPTPSRRYAVIGTGAVGALYGARLVTAGHRVAFLLRSDYDHVRANGLVVESPLGDVHLPPTVAHAEPATMGPADVVLVALKTTANDALGHLLPPLLGDATAVVLLQNGLQRGCRCPPGGRPTAPRRPGLHLLDQGGPRPRAPPGLRPGDPGRAHRRRAAGRHHAHRVGGGRRPGGSGRAGGLRGRRGGRPLEEAGLERAVQLAVGGARRPAPGDPGRSLGPGRG
ncbi:MAG: 2-dehydropantoate 2-reductase N-terminal domain-containing protein [Acidimicrobiales bacterium]